MEAVVTSVETITVEQTRQMLLDKVRRGENVWSAIVRFEIDITEADGDVECEQIVCKAYWEVHARWAQRRP